MMNTPIDALRTQLQALNNKVSALVSEGLYTLLFGWTLTSKSSAMGAADEVQTSDDASNSQRPVRRIEPFGLRSRTPSKLRALWMRLSSSNVVFIGIAPSKGYGPNDLEDGEVAVYNISKALVRLWKTGKLTIDSDNDDVVVNGGTKKVGRVGDDVDMGSWQVTVAVAPSPAAGAILSISWTPPGGGAPTVFSAATTGPFPLTGKISSGADHFKG